jgi:YHS domain-containing protein
VAALARLSDEPTGAKDMNQQPQNVPQDQQQPGKAVFDPVCGMEVQHGKSDGGQVYYQGEIYDFCSMECREKFEANPAQYTTH